MKIVLKNQTVNIAKYAYDKTLAVICQKTAATPSQREHHVARINTKVTAIILPEFIIEIQL
ncbi:MAG: hypothetical protein P1U47_11070 [Zhongshania sp.]|uniref:Uncharacterized protein n=1 Tax=Zhongshania guokunii TaxID=641783 RepID=A0ABV3U9R2_9GAMM|nr:hypothetical protein [Zhongshania sp.]MDF1692909.1 hypothetical protein [Zhongshania sp.]